jgi:ATP-dependent DNA helicase RecG
VKNPVDFCLDVENKINDSIKPNPDYNLKIDEQTNVVTLTVNQGDHPPYLYKSKAYKRNDSASIEVDRAELSQLILIGENKTYDGLTATNQDLSFNVLEDALKEKLGIRRLTSDVLITLNLKQKDGYTNAGELLADKNHYRGIDIIRFGENISIMLDRASYENESILKEYDQALQKYRQYYQHEEIQGATRNVVSLIPEEAFREAIANALVHRIWSVNSQIKVSMFDDRIEVTSPGGLPQGLSKNEYLAGQISILRNPIIANVFFRLGLIEQFGTGIRRIKDSYQKSLVQPQFAIFENSIKIVLPVLKFVADDLTADENRIYQSIHEGASTTTKISQATGFGRTKALRLLKQLSQRGYVEKIGEGRATRYILSK